MRVPHAFSARTMNSGPSAASRTAAVAKASEVLDLEDAGDGPKRTSASAPAATASSPSRPVVAIERPSPHSTFSLNSGVGARTAPS